MTYYEKLTQLNEISAKLTDIHADNEEGIKDE